MKKFTVVFFIAALVLSAAFNFGVVQGENISDSVLRLHIPANSNSVRDQEIKLKIRDKVIEKYSSFLKETQKKEDAEKLIKEKLADIEKDVNLWLLQEGADYKASVGISYSDFPVKNYGGIKLPAGTYKALKIVLGNGKGENWWCIMFPPLCFVEGSVKEVSEKDYELLKKELGKTAFELVTKEGKSVFLKFKIVEIVNNIIG